MRVPSPSKARHVRLDPACHFQAFGIGHHRQRLCSTRSRTLKRVESSPVGQDVHGGGDKIPPRSGLVSLGSWSNAVASQNGSKSARTAAWKFRPRNCTDIAELRSARSGKPVDVGMDAPAHPSGAEPGCLNGGIFRPYHAHCKAVSGFTQNGAPREEALSRWVVIQIQTIFGLSSIPRQTRSNDALDRLADKGKRSCVLARRHPETCISTAAVAE